jgi:hypothetical protein
MIFLLKLLKEFQMQTQGEKPSAEMKANGGRIGYAEKGKVSLSDLESLKKFKSDSVEAEQVMPYLVYPEE